MVSLDGSGLNSFDLDQARSLRIVRFYFVVTSIFLVGPVGNLSLQEQYPNWIFFS